VVCTAAAAKDLFKLHDAAFSDRPKRLDHQVISGTTYKSLTSAPYGPYWRQVRRVCNTELFSPAVHASHENARKEEIHNMMKVILDECKSEGAAIDLKTWTTGVTANNMTRMLINKRYFGTGVTDQQEKKDFEEVNDHVLGAISTVYISDFIPYLAFVEKLQGHIRKLQKIRTFLRRVVGKIFEVEKHRQRTLERGQEDANYVPDFVDVLLKTPLDDGEQFTDGEIISILSSMILAGTDSSAVTVEWAMAELMAHPAIRKKAQEELDAVVGNARLVQEADLPNLPFLSAIIKETFRLHPPVPLSLPRSSNQPCIVANRQFPANTRLILNIFSIHRDPSVYENPEAFQPSRFLEHPEVDHMSGQSFYQLIPFGVGRRMCPASHLGNTMVTLMLAHLLHSFDWSLPAGVELDMAEVYKLVGFRKHPLSLLAKPRSPAFLY
jgi:cytochrome P450